MQMTFDQAPRLGTLQAFSARRKGYMMRSERRSGYSGNSPRGRKPRRKRAGILYIFLTLLVSLVLWPIGMVMLWRRKVRMTAGTKLLISLVTLALSVVLIVYALTMPVDNPKFTAFQDRANDTLDKAADQIAVAGEAAYKKGVETWAVMRDFGEAAADYSVRQMADGLDKGVELASDARVRIEKLIKPGETGTPEETPSATGAPEETKPTETEIPEETEAAPTEAAEATDEPGANETREPEENETEAPEETEAPSASPESVVNEALNIHVPSTPPKSELAVALGAGTLRSNGAFEANEVPEGKEAEPTPEESGEPEPTVSALSTQTAVEEPTEAPQEEPAETEAPEDDAAEAAEGEAEKAKENAAEDGPAEEGASVPAEPAEEEPAAEPSAEPSAEPTAEPTVEPTAEPTPEPTEAPTPEPTGTPLPEVKVKSAADATVYYYGTSKGYHTRNCKFMGTGVPEHTLAEAIAAGKHACGSCKPPAADLLNEEYVAWVDADNRIHTTDECESFKGGWRLISLESAIKSGCETCPDCQADVYAVQSGLSQAQGAAAQ